jgi:hypothetical protein
MIEVKFVKPKTKTHKLTAIFFDGDKKIKTTNFGAKGASDFTKNKDPERKKRYLDRHRKRENWNSYMTAGSLSRYVLWNKESLNASIKDYVKRFKLKLKK